MRVFIGPNEVAGQYRNLALALNAAGVECDYYVFDNENLRYGGDIGDSGFPSYIRRLSDFRKNARRSLRFGVSLVIEVLSAIFLLRCIFRYDAFLFGFGGSFLRGNIDLPLLRLCGKTLVANLSHGSDMTPPYIDGALLDEQMRMPPLEALIKRATKIRERADRFEKYADFIIGSPISSSFYFNKPFINIFQVGRVSQGFRYIETDTSDVAGESGIFSAERKLRIVHAPSHAPGKGTALIRAMISDLVGSGYPIDFVEITGKTSDTVIQALRQCDLVLDQVYADLPMSGLAAEAACFGKPTLIAGYELLKLKSMTPSECFPPSLICSPDEMTETLKFFLDNPEHLASAGKAAQRFVKEEWGEEKVALRYLNLLTKKEIPEAWWHDPKSAIFLHGYGLSETTSKEIVAEIIEACGINGLGFGRRPDLERAFLEYSKISG